MSKIIFIKIVFILATAAVAAWHWRKIRMGMASKKWLKTTGTMLSSDMDFIEDADDRERGYKVSVEYSYKVGLQLFRSRRLTFEPTAHLTLAEARRLLSLLENRREIDVFYNPEDNSQSVVITGISNKNKWQLAFWLALFVAALISAKYWQTS